MGGIRMSGMMASRSGLGNCETTFRGQANTDMYLEGGLIIDKVGMIGSKTELGVVYVLRVTSSASYAE